MFRNEHARMVDTWLDPIVWRTWVMRGRRVDEALTLLSAGRR